MSVTVAIAVFSHCVIADRYWKCMHVFFNILHSNYHVIFDRDTFICLVSSPFRLGCPQIYSHQTTCCHFLPLIESLVLLQPCGFSHITSLMLFNRTFWSLWAAFHALATNHSDNYATENQQWSCACPQRFCEGKPLSEALGVAEGISRIWPHRWKRIGDLRATP